MRTASGYAWIAMVILFCTAMAILLVLSSGGAHAWFETRDAKLQSVKTVGIISAIGDQFTFEKAGLTGLDNSSRSGPIASWGLDDLMAQQVTDALSIRFQMQPVTYPRATFATTRESAITAVNLVRGDPFKKLVQTEVSPQGLDAYIVITKAKAYFGGGSRKVEGVGLIRYSTVLESFDLLHVERNRQVEPAIGVSATQHESIVNGDGHNAEIQNRHDNKQHWDSSHCHDKSKPPNG